MGVEEMLSLRKIFTAVSMAAAVSAVAASGPAMAIDTQNGASFNGIHWNGQTTQGIKLQGIKLQGIKLQGIKLQGFSLDGHATEDRPAQGSKGHGRADRADTAKQGAPGFDARAVTIETIRLPEAR